MGGSLSEGLRTVFAVVLACLVIGFAFMLWTTLSQKGKDAQSDLTSVSEQMMASGITQYDGAVITGTELVNLIQQNMKKKICIKVTIPVPSGTARVEEYIMSEDLSSVGVTDLSDAKDSSNDYYISPTATFKGELIMDNATDSIRGLHFTRQ